LGEEPSASPQKTGKMKLEASSLQGRIASLTGEDYFQSPKTANEVRSALKERGYAYDVQSVSVGLMRLVRKKYLRRLSESDTEGKQIFVYVNP